VAEMTSAPGASDIAAWQKDIIKPGATVTQTNPAAVGANPQAIDLYNMPPAQRQQIALALKNAGYKVPTTGAFSTSLLTAFSSATLAAQTQAQLLGMPFDSKFFEGYLAQETAARTATAGATGGPKKTVQVRVSDPTSAKALINTIIKDQLGREATADEVKKYTAALQKAQKAAPVTTTYTTKGGVTTSQTTGGINEQQYLIDKVSGTDESKANKVLSFYETFMNALGRD
jgi:hypothetical protein